MKTTSVGVHLHGASLTLDGAHAPLIAYATQHLGPLAGHDVATPDLAVRAHWSEGPWDASTHPFGDRPRRTIGKRMRGDDDELIWLDTLRMAGLQLCFRRDPRHWCFDVAYRYQPKIRRGEPVPGYEVKRYFSLMSYLVYYPLLWHLERTRAWSVLHASTLATPRGGIVVAGLGGVGKTTTCVALLQRPDIELVAENLVLTDGARVYSVYEPIRLDEGSLALLGGAPPQFVPMEFQHGLKKKELFHLRRPPVERVEPRLLLLPEFSSRRGLFPIAAELAAEKLTAMNRLTRELDDYGAYAAALDLNWPRAGFAGTADRVLRTLARSARCFVLGIDRAAGLDAVTDDILGGLD